MTFETVFDASRQSDVTHWLLAAGMIVGALAVFASPRIRTRTPYGLGYLLPLIAVIFAIVMAIAIFVQRKIIADDLGRRHYEILEGSVTDWVRPRQDAGGYRAGFFIVGGRRFSIPNYIVTAGFDNQGGAIEVGHVVRITHDGDMILRVEVQR